MKRIILFICIWVFLLTACNNENMKNKETSDEYLTITYHGTGSTKGEPPIDSKKYKPAVINPTTFNLDFYENAVVLDYGTLENTERPPTYPHTLPYAWKKRAYDYTDASPRWEGENLHPGDKIGVLSNIDFDPVW